MSNLFQITAKAQELAFALETGELTEELENELVINQNELQQKAVNYGFVVKSLESDISIIDEEIKRLTAIKKAKNAAVDRMKESVLHAMNIYGIEKITSPTLNISIRNNPEATEIVNEDQIPERFKNQKVIISIDKTAIKKAIQSGENVEGAILTRSQSLKIG